ncbi:MAG: hypothetical protein AAF824_03670 [Bacteroidota bacterium]
MSNLDSIKERISLYLTYLYARWLFILLLGVGLGLILYFYASRKPVIYIATTVFHPETNEAPSEVDLNNPASFITSTLGGNNLSANNQMIGVIMSRRISELVVKDSIVKEDSTVLLADLISSQFKPGFSFTKFLQSLIKNQQQPTPLDFKIIKAGAQVRNSLTVITNDYGFIEMSLSFRDPSLAKETSLIYIDVIKQYYAELKSEKSQSSMDFLANRRDSVKTELDLTNQRIASFYDRNKYGVSTRPEVFLKEQQTKSEMLARMYGELVIAFETTKAQFLKESPIIQVLDYPDPPFQSIRPKTTGYFLLGIFMGILIGVMIIVGRLLWEDLQRVITRALSEQLSGISISKELPGKKDS